MKPPQPETPPPRAPSLSQEKSDFTAEGAPPPGTVPPASPPLPPGDGAGKHHRRPGQPQR